MKKIYSVIILCVAVFASGLFIACDEDIIPTETVLSVIDEEITPSHSTCQITCSFHTDATIEYASVQYSTTEDFAKYNVTKMIPKSDYYDDNGSYSVKLTKLQPNTTYYFRYEVNACLFTSSVANKVSEFQTLQTAIPVVTISIKDIYITSATANGQIISDGGLSITEYGVVYSTSKNPTIANTKLKSNNCDSDGLFTCDLTNLQKQTTYYARAYATNAKGIGYSEEISFTADYQYVDLGLSVKWATCNVGATKPEEPGDYFAWGETKPKDYYDWSNYKWCAGDYDDLTKYCDYSSYAYASSYVDKIYVLQLSDDAARANWGGKWRMPLKSEFDELYASCTWESTTQNGTAGYLVTGKNGKSIFLPKAGDKYHGSLDDLGSYGYYWSSTVCPYSYNSTYPFRAYAYGNGNKISEFLRCCGLPVRPVCP